MSKVLVVDDDPDFCEITRLILSKRGYEVETASNGDMALRMMREERPAVVVLDVMMAGVLDGVSVAHAMANEPDLCKVPIVMVSSIASSQSADMFPTDDYIPIDAWISKPVQPDELIATVSRLTR
ncbi:MAG: response regulator transcription factor [Anaerolineae bacterium]|jgi:two-component system alkaline phosphatase synthesis response regulator PhoP